MGRETMALKLRVGVAQIAPKFFDKTGTLKKTIQVIEEGGKLGLDLLVFPETYFSAYPYWRGSVSVKRSTELIVQMQRSALRIPGEETEELEAAARRARVNCVRRKRSFGLKSTSRIGSWPRPTLTAWGTTPGSIS